VRVRGKKEKSGHNSSGRGGAKDVRGKVWRERISASKKTGSRGEAAGCENRRESRTRKKGRKYPSQKGFEEQVSRLVGGVWGS